MIWRVRRVLTGHDSEGRWDYPRQRGSMSQADKRKQSLYFPEDMLKEIQDEATRQDRSLSWIVQKAWKIARNEVVKYPSVNDLEGGDDDVRGRDE